jgi:hypothetical protein
MSLHESLSADELSRLAESERIAHQEPFFIGEDRSSHYPGCECHDRFGGGRALHPGGVFDPGPCYFDEHDGVGFYPE